MKAIAAEKPTHYGIFFYPISLPLLFISKPNTKASSMSSAILGTSILVRSQAKAEATKIKIR